MIWHILPNNDFEFYFADKETINADELAQLDAGCPECEQARHGVDTSAAVS